MKNANSHISAPAPAARAATPKIATGPALPALSAAELPPVSSLPVALPSFPTTPAQTGLLNLTAPVTPSITGAPNPSGASPESEELASLAIARELLPPALRHRKFRAHAFMSKLTVDQRAILHAWFKSNDSVETIRQKIAAPLPAGFGLQVSPTSLYRLRAVIENTDTVLSLSRAMETAQDVLESEDASSAAPLREALSLMLYSRAIHAAQQHVDPQRIDKLLGAIAKIEKLKSRAAIPASSRKNTSRPGHLSDHPSSHYSAHPPTTRHIVELTVTTNPSNVVHISASNLPPERPSKSSGHQGAPKQLNVAPASSPAGSGSLPLPSIGADARMPLRPHQPHASKRVDHPPGKVKEFDVPETKLLP